MGLTAAVPPRPSSSRTCPMSRRSAPFTAARSGSRPAGRPRAALDRFAIVLAFLTRFRVGFFFVICLLLNRPQRAMPGPTGYYTIVRTALARRLTRHRDYDDAESQATLSMRRLT